MSYVLPDGVENLTLTGGGNINGTGNGASNFIVGNDGNNTLAGLGGADTLTGGLGADTFVFGLDATGIATITDFVSGTDKIYTDAIYRVEADVALIAKRHRERGIPLTNDDLDYYSVLDQIADNTIWKSAPSFVLDGNSLEQSAEIVLENMGLATSSQELTMLGGRPTSVF